MKHVSLKFLAPLSLIILLGAGCAGSTPSEKINTTEKTSAIKTTTEPVENPAAENEHADGDHIAKLAGSRVDLKNRNNLKTGLSDLSFQLYGEDGHAFGPDDLKTTHEKKLHFLIVRDDMTQFQHVHPEFKNNLWTVATTIPKQGNYQFYVDIAPVEEQISVLRIPVVIGGSTQDATAPVPNSDLSAQDGDYKAVVSIESPVRTKETKSWTFALTKNGQPVANVNPYLGAYGHVVELRHGDQDDFFHVHPVTKDQPKDGKVVFEGTFPSKGRYTLYAQFDIDGSIKTFPITLDVNEEGKASPSAKH